MFDWRREVEEQLNPDSRPKWRKGQADKVYADADGKSEISDVPMRRGRKPDGDRKAHHAGDEADPDVMHMDHIKPYSELIHTARGDDGIPENLPEDEALFPDEDRWHWKDGDPEALSYPGKARRLLHNEETGHGKNKVSAHRSGEWENLQGITGQENQEKGEQRGLRRGQRAR
jgi:hypothetical protein